MGVTPEQKPLGRYSGGVLWSSPEGRSIAWRSRTSREWDVAAIEPKVEQHRKGQIWTLELSAQLDIDVYQSAWAEVVVHNGMDFSAAPLVDQRLSEN